MKFYQTETGIETSEGIFGTTVLSTPTHEAYTEVIQLINERTNRNNWQGIRTILNQFERAYGHIDSISRANVLRRMKISLEKVI